MNKETINFEPKISLAHREEFLLFAHELKRVLSRRTPEQKYDILANQKEKTITLNGGKNFHKNTDLIFCESLLIDLLLQDWELKIKNDKIKLELYIADEVGKNALEEKAKTRRRHLLARDTQLNEPSVKEFICGMEKRRLTNKGWHSIYSLMRDGKELTEELRNIQTLKNVDEQVTKLSMTIKPYIDIVKPGKKCAQTGLELSDIWRYYRHTWINEYKSLPGRSISILIRDAAYPGHPVIGIAALGSSVAQQSCRDEWLGWEGSTLLRKIEKSPTKKYATWIKDSFDTLLSEVYIKDFLRSQIISLKDIKEPTIEKIKELRVLALKYKKQHIDNPSISKFSPENSNLSWEERAQSYLFKSKRATYFAEILSIKYILNKYNFKKGTKRELQEALSKADFQETIKKLARKIKSLSVGINMMDIIVCGSIAPYNNLLGGKLVCMLLTSPEITSYYNEKYANSISLIASSMRGKPVNRKPQLVMLGTTSLYGSGSSQYNRIKIPVSEIIPNSEQKIEYKELGYSEGYGSFHFSNNTIKLADAVSGREHGRTRVNSIFGEGANPLLRKLKDAIEYLKLESNPILNHRNRRIVYGIALAENFREILLGMDRKAKYYLPQKRQKLITESIANYWKKRWLANRIMNDEVLERVAKNTLDYPVTHGARVQMKETDVDDIQLTFKN